MAERKDPGFLPALPVLTETFTVTDKRHPGESWEFTLSVPLEMSFSDVWFVQDRTDRWIAEYVNGDKFVETNNQFVPIESKLCEHIAMLYEAETLATGNTWQFPQWVVFQHKAPNAWADLCSKYYDLFYRARPPKEDGETEAETAPKNA